MLQEGEKTKKGQNLRTIPKCENRVGNKFNRVSFATDDLHSRIVVLCILFKPSWDDIDFEVLIFMRQVSSSG